MEAPPSWGEQAFPSPGTRRAPPPLRKAPSQPKCTSQAGLGMSNWPPGLLSFRAPHQNITSAGLSEKAGGLPPPPRLYLRTPEKPQADTQQQPTSSTHQDQPAPPSYHQPSSPSPRSQAAAHATHPTGRANLCQGRTPPAQEPQEAMPGGLPSATLMGDPQGMEMCPPTPSTATSQPAGPELHRFAPRVPAGPGPGKRRWQPCQGDPSGF